MNKILNCAGKILDLSVPRVMGILNLTPDSFADGGQHNLFDAAISHAHKMVAEGAAIIDVGGESTRPGAQDVSVDEELQRVIPVIERLANELDIPISIDTCKTQVMREAVAAGAGLINDVTALRDEGAVEFVASVGVPVCLMHMQGTPRMMQQDPQYADVTTDVADFLRDRINCCERAGISCDRLIADPGFGFGKTLQHNMQLMRELEKFHELDVPLLVGVSRKSMLGSILDAGVADRLYGSIALQTLAVWKGAHIIRSHDVKAAADAVRTIQAVAGQESGL